MRSHLLFPAITLFSFCAAAHADTFDISFGTASSQFSGSGVLTTGTLIAPMEYRIASITGLVSTQTGESSAIESLLAPGTFPTPTNGGTYPANDDILFVTQGVGTLTEYGLSFLLRDGAQINLYEDGSGPGELLKPGSGINSYEDAPITIKVVPTPEPSSLVLVGTGLLTVAGAAKRRLLRQ